MMQVHDGGGFRIKDIPDGFQRWTANRRAALVLQIRRGETSVQDAARRHGLKVSEVEGWRQKFLEATEKLCDLGRRRRRASRISGFESWSARLGDCPGRGHPGGGDDVARFAEKTSEY
jgi:hypothetical protein